MGPARSHLQTFTMMAAFCLFCKYLHSFTGKNILHPYFELIFTRILCIIVCILIIVSAEK